MQREPQIVVAQSHVDAFFGKARMNLRIASGGCVRNGDNGRSGADHDALCALEPGNEPLPQRGIMLLNVLKANSKWIVDGGPPRHEIHEIGCAKKVECR